VLLACHIDEIGFYVRHIDSTGFVRIQNVGGFDTRNLLARRVLVQASSGEDLIGLLNPGGRPIHIAKDEDKKKIPEITDFAVDLCIPAEEVKKKVRIGDPVTLVQEFSEIGHCVTGKCLDNRVAAFVAIEAVKKAAHCKYEVVLAATVQEEVGCRGAGPAAYACQPDIAIAIDTTLCVDTPGVPEDERVTKQGDGAGLTVMDSLTISDRGMIDEFEAVAKKREIPYQLSILPKGGTDAGPMQRSRGGLRTMTLSVPTRYIHTVTECIHKRDLQSAIDLLGAWLED
jgi:endoglucanase